MRRSSDQADDSSSFQRTPSYRIATVNGRKTDEGTVVARGHQANENDKTTVPQESAPVNYADFDSNANSGKDNWKRRRSYSNSTADSDMATAIWNTNFNTAAPSPSSHEPSSGSQSSVQRRGSYCDAVKIEGQTKKSKGKEVAAKAVQRLKAFKNTFYRSDPNSHAKDDRNQLIDEPDPNYIRRWASIWLTWIIMFILVVQFSMYSSTLGVYLPLIDPTADESFAPWAISAFGFGQTIACPIFGWWSNRIKNNRLPMACGLMLMIVGNIAFCFVEVFPANRRKWLVFFFRFVIGFGGGIAGVIRAYCATAAKPHEYMKAVTGATAGLSLAIMAGPGAQAIFTPIGYPGISLGVIRLHMYNAPALASIFIGILCLVLLYTVLLQVYPGLAKDEVKDPWFVLPKYDVCATWVVIFCWFAAYLTLTSFVMIGKSYTMVMFHWSYVEAIVDNGIIMGVFACISLVIFIVYAYHGKRFDERFLMYVGISMMCLFFLVTFPWPGLPRLYSECGVLPCCNPNVPISEQKILCVDLGTINKTNLMAISQALALAANGGDHRDSQSLATFTTLPPETHEPGHAEDFPGGCQAVKYKWCDTVTKEPIGLYMGTFFLLAVGFPMANCAFSALFSKIIGPRRQGFMQGVIISGGAAARTSGPLFINYTFDWWGPRVSWGLTAAILVASIALSVAYYRRLVPLDPKPKLNPGEHFRYKKGVLYRF